MRLQALRVCFITLFLTTFAMTAGAQVIGYGVAGPAGAMGFVNTRRMTFTVAGGAEIFLQKYVTVGGDRRGATHYWALRVGVVFR